MTTNYLWGVRYQVFWKLQEKGSIEPQTVESWHDYFGHLNLYTCIVYKITAAATLWNVNLVQ